MTAQPNTQPDEQATDPQVRERLLKACETELGHAPALRYRLVRATRPGNTARRPRV